MLAQLSDDELFSEIVRRRSAAEDFRDALGVLCERWRSPGYAVVRRIQGSYLRGSPDDGPEIFQEAVGKFIEKGLAQFRGVSEHLPGKAASPRTFFLRIVKHAAIDRYRRQREELAAPAADDDGGSATELPGDSARALAEAEHRGQAADAREEYWRAFERLRTEHPNEAAAWELYHHQDLDDHDECAKILEITVANSYKRVSRAQAYLKLYLLEFRSEEESR
ncbi:MAG: RNA polymerase sigma factor [Myxococcaceae bacterium]